MHFSSRQRLLRGAFSKKKSPYIPMIRGFAIGLS
jgi:hypothetical protein